MLAAWAASTSAVEQITSFPYLFVLGDDSQLEPGRFHSSEDCNPDVTVNNTDKQKAITANTGYIMGFSPSLPLYNTILLQFQCSLNCDGHLKLLLSMSSSNRF